MRASQWIDNDGPGDWYADLLCGYSEYDNDIDRKTFGGTAKDSTDSTTRAGHWKNRFCTRYA